MQYYSIGSNRISKVKIKRSTFICSLKCVETISEAKEFISLISSEHKTATHNCWAYIVGNKADISHSSDNGEPSGSAGKPILNTLQTYNMTNISAVVTRYYGGVKLGVRGLIEAYSHAVITAIELYPLKKIEKIKKYTIDLSYSFNDTFIYQLSNFKANIIHTKYSDKISHDVEVNEDMINNVDAFLIEYQNIGKLVFRIIS